MIFCCQHHLNLPLIFDLYNVIKIKYEREVSRVATDFKIYALISTGLFVAYLAMAVTVSYIS